MGGRGSWSASSETFSPTLSGGGGGGGTPETVIGPRIPESLSEALGTKGSPMQPASASRGTNPHFSTDYEAYSYNCQRCVLAYEARRRGYDVTALPTYSGDMLPYSHDYLKALSNPEVVHIGKSVNKLVAQMKQYGSGSRAIVSVGRGDNGHAFIAENIRGKIVYIDPQSNKRYNKLSLASVTRADLVRIDNQQFTDYARNAFTRQKV